ncbi:MAG: hypothetical protein D6711_18825 [Chloroflexi bacterium]|nr:MAG: hypothetical protein D6711_18825 [Chloroflexota bacterium]
MQTEFIHKLTSIQQQKQSRIALLLTPMVEMMPVPVRRYDDPFLPFGKLVINATRDLVCAYIFDLASYLAIGAAGIVALERTLAYAIGDTITILHGPFATTAYTNVLEEQFLGFDAVTVTSSTLVPAYTQRPDRFAFVVQDYLNTGQQLVVDKAKPLVITGKDILYYSQKADFEVVLREQVKQLKEDHD